MKIITKTKGIDNQTLQLVSDSYDTIKCIRKDISATFLPLLKPEIYEEVETGALMDEIIKEIRGRAEHTAQLLKGADVDEILQSRADTISILFDNIKDIAQQTLYPDQEKPQRLYIHQIIEEFQTTYAGMIDITIDSKTPPPPTIIERTALIRVIDNLLSNANKYGRNPDALEENATVDIGWERDGGTIIVHIRDYGRGIPEEDIEKIFELDYRLKRDTDAEIEGTGTGLAVVKQYVKALGGQISAHNNEHGGATFTFTLPIIQDL